MHRCDVKNNTGNPFRSSDLVVMSHARLPLRHAGNKAAFNVQLDKMSEVGIEPTTSEVLSHSPPRAYRLRHSDKGLLCFSSLSI